MVFPSMLMVFPLQLRLSSQLYRQSATSVGFRRSNTRLKVSLLGMSFCSSMNFVSQFFRVLPKVSMSCGLLRRRLLHKTLSLLWCIVCVVGIRIVFVGQLFFRFARLTFVFSYTQYTIFLKIK
jgi:hypothetical protein